MTRLIASFNVEVYAVALCGNCWLLNSKLPFLCMKYLALYFQANNFLSSISYD